MDARDVEHLLKRYRPGDPSKSLDERIAGLVDPLKRRTLRVWPWAAAAAALLAITVGLHASVGVRPKEPLRIAEFNEDVAALASDFGGAPGVRRLAELMLRREAVERERQQEASQAR